MDEFGFSSGLLSRLFRKILPKVPDENTIEFILLYKDDPVPYLVSKLNLDGISDSQIPKQLDLSIKALCSKLIAFGLDSDIKSKYNFIHLDSMPFETLLDKLQSLTECSKSDTHELLASLNQIELLITNLRKNKHKIGTSIHLTLTTRRLLEYTHRIKELLTLKLNIGSRKHWENLFLECIKYYKYKNSIRRYIKRHSDLVALEIVEHTSNKGNKYIAANKKEYWSFFSKSLLGGSIIALFALIKIVIDSYQLSQLWDAALFSLNYALCFIVVKQLGGIIATKQPAMTASTLAKNIDKRDVLQIDSINSVTLLVRKVFRSQFISIIGNFLMALSLAASLMWLLQLFEVRSLTKLVMPEYLIGSVTPSFKLLYYAAIAGFFLALSGLISGDIDNKVVASKIVYRIRSNPSFLFRSKWFGSFIEKKAGALAGNICLGFFLGSIFLLNNFLPFAFDIRHIAFSSAYVGYSVMSCEFNVDTIMLAIVGVLLIGFVNFIVSFSTTLYLALKSRGVSVRLIPAILTDIIKDFFKYPLHYFIKIESEKTSQND